MNEDIPREDFLNCKVLVSRLKNEDGEHIGLGLFADRDIIHRGSGTYICSYLGKRVLTSVASRDNYTSLYVISWGKYSVDGDDFESSFGRFANDPIFKNKINAKIMKHPEGTAEHPKFQLVTTKTIKENDEIYISYGDSYWKASLPFESLNADAQHELYRRSKLIKDWVDRNY